MVKKNVRRTFNINETTLSNIERYNHRVAKYNPAQTARH